MSRKRGGLVGHGVVICWCLHSTTKHHVPCRRLTPHLTASHTLPPQAVGNRACPFLPAFLLLRNRCNCTNPKVCGAEQVRVRMRTERGAEGGPAQRIRGGKGAGDGQGEGQDYEWLT